MEQYNTIPYTDSSIVNNIVFSGNSGNVEQVMVNGKIIMKKGSSKTGESSFSGLNYL